MQVKFALIYIIPMIITYVCSWMGSTSMLTAKVNPHFWTLFIVHVGCYVIIIYNCLNLPNKKSICIFPILAAVFDLFPIVNYIPFVPTGLNVAGIVSGIINLRPHTNIEVNSNGNTNVTAVAGNVGNGSVVGSSNVNTGTIINDNSINNGINFNSNNKK